MIRTLLNPLREAALWLIVDGAAFAAAGAILVYTESTGANWRPWLLATLATAAASLAATLTINARDARQHRATHNPDTCEEC